MGSITHIKTFINHKSQVEDARTALEVYKKFRLQWERNVDKYLECFDEPCWSAYVPDQDYCMGYSGDEDCC
jgi:hypothetical protein